MITTADAKRMERSKGGMPKFALLRPYWSHLDGKPFLTRFIFIFCRRFGCHVTWIRQPDARTWPHDHSAPFWSLQLAGSYDEDVFDDPARLDQSARRRHRWLTVTPLRADQAHSITRVSRFCVTILFLGRRCQKSKYWTPDGEVPLGMTMDEDPSTWS